MKQTKQWVVVAVMGLVSVSIFVILAISTNFTPKAMAAGEHLAFISRLYLPFINNSGLPSATTITSHIPDPSVPGQAVVVGVTVSGAGIPVPTGTVYITGADSNCSILLAGGSGSCSVNFNTTGNKILTATYISDGVYASSSGSASHIVEKGSTTTTITTDTPDPSIPTQAVMVSFTVNGAGTTPTGTVAITGAETNCSITLSGGSGSCAVIFNTFGDKTLTATYSGDINYLSSTDTEPHSVRNPTITTITSDILDPSVPGESVHVIITVVGDGVITPQGDVIITGTDTPGIVSCGLVGGTCAVDVVFNTAGARTITATYDPGLVDLIYAGSVGTASHTVNRGIPTIEFTSVDPEPSITYQLVTVTVQVDGAGVPPTGAVGISISGQPSTCSFTLSTPPPFPPEGHCDVVFNTTGTFTITATYSGDGNYLGGVNVWTHTVN